MLTNRRSDRVKAVHSLARKQVRDREGLFLAEGPQSVREVVGWRPDCVRDVYVTPSAAQRHRAIVEAADRAGIYLHEVSDEVLAAMSDTPAPQGLLAVCRDVRVGLYEVLATGPARVCVLTNVRDPGNAGTVIRAADAAGADAVLVTGQSVDVLAPKVVRSGAGSHFHVPLVTGLAVADALSALRDNGIRLIAADGAGSALLPDLDLSGRHAWVFGNEAWGMADATRSLCDEVVRVPILGKAESLNLAMAATVCLYASAFAVGKPQSPDGR